MYLLKIWDSIKDAIGWRWASLLNRIDEGRFPHLPQWVRLRMDEATAAFVSGLSYKDLSVLEISGTKWADFGFKSYKSADYPSFDICEQSLDEQFDLVIIEQVLEHVLWPFRAAKNLHAMVADDGHLIVTTPFLVGIHNAPIDCCRWTELGMKQLLAEGGFDPEKITTGSWGNRACIKASFRRIPRFHPSLHRLEAEEKFPQVVWAFARK